VKCFSITIKSDWEALFYFEGFVDAGVIERATLSRSAYERPPETCTCIVVGFIL